MSSPEQLKKKVLKSRSYKKHFVLFLLLCFYACLKYNWNQNTPFWFWSMFCCRKITGWPRAFLSKRMITTLKWSTFDPIMIKLKCVWYLYNFSFSSAFWLYQNVVKSSSFLCMLQKVVKECSEVVLSNICTYLFFQSNFKPSTSVEQKGKDSHQSNSS